MKNKNSYIKFYILLFLLTTYLIFFTLIAFSPLQNLKINKIPLSETIGLYTIEEKLVQEPINSPLLRMLGENEIKRKIKVKHFNSIAFFTYIGIGIIIFSGLFIISFKFSVSSK